MCDCLTCFGTNRGCCSFPHSCLSIWAIVFALITYFLSADASFGCHFTYIDLSQPNDLDGLPNIDYYGLGLMTRQSTNSATDSTTIATAPATAASAGNYDYRCSEYTPRETTMYFDAAWRTSRAFCIMGMICVGIGLITSVLLSCFALPPYWLDITAVLYLLAALFFGLTFTAYASDLCTDYGCTFGVGSGMMVGAIISCIIMAWIYYSLPNEGESMKRCCGNGDGDDGGRGCCGRDRSNGSNHRFGAGRQTCVETKQADGTTKIVKTTNNGDGTVTVEETIKAAEGRFW